MTDQLMTEETFARYRRHCESKGYCEPFVPYVGDQYGQPGHVKLVYCGGAAAWNEKDIHRADDHDAFLYNAEKYENFVLQEMYGSAFWRLFHDIADITPGLATATEDERRRRFAWTNLSKAGVEGESAPPDNDKELSKLDVEQFHHEMQILKPDLLVCVSGSLVTSTGFAIFETLEWPNPGMPEPKAKSTWIRRSPWGGWLYWTMHPAYKSNEWREEVLADVQAILTEIAKEKAVLPG